MVLDDVNCKLGCKNIGLYTDLGEWKIKYGQL